MKIAVIDMGTNTFQLLLAEHVPDKPLQILAQDQLFVRLGKGGISRGHLHPEAIQRALDAIVAFHEQASAFGADKILAVATSAVRSAQNAEELLSKIYQQTGIRPLVISGELEATLIFEGIQAEGLVSQPVLVMDIGGGSVEFILGDPQGISWKTSLEIGGQRLLDRLSTAEDPPSDAEIQELERFIEESLAEVARVTDEFRPHYLVGSAGAFETMAAICTARYAKTGSERLRIQKDELEQIVKWLNQLPRAARMHVSGLIPERADTIIAAGSLMRTALRCTALTEVRVSRYSLKEGVAWRILNGHSLAG